MFAAHSVEYCKADISNLENNLNEDSKHLLQYSIVRHPYPPSFHPEIDTFTELDENGVHGFQQHICVLLWEIQFVRIDIMTKASTLSQYLCDPRVNHFESAYKIYHYLNNNMKLNPGRVVSDPTYQEIDDRFLNTSPR